ncbi:MAG: sulfurtransferase [Acidobacteria bacterium]|nr:sulfurtransferase [Acidobacteriota bacterium]
MKHSEAFDNLCNEAKSRIREITIEEVKQKQEAGESFLFLDIREDHEWMQGRAAGATHLGRGILERDIHNLAENQEAEIVLYCGGGYRSALSADNLQKMGYRNVFSMAGGIRSWREAGYPVEQ